MACIEKLILSNNSKTKFSKKHNNTFGLMYGLPENGGTCPGASTGLGGCLSVRDGKKRATCYMAKIAQIYKGAAAVLQKNTDLLKDKPYEEMVEIIRNTINHFVKNTRSDQLYFRLNYSGDIYSENLAKAWATVMKEFPQVKFWMYTRSFDFVEFLRDIPNLTLFLSVDPANCKEGFATYEKHKDQNNLALAWMGNLVPDKEKWRWVTCPEISGKVKNTEDKGACGKCRLCIDRYVTKVKNIHFPIH